MKHSILLKGLAEHHSPGEIPKTAFVGRQVFHDTIDPVAVGERRFPAKGVGHEFFTELLVPGEETLVIWGGEFGRSPMNAVRRGNTPGKEGRDHHPLAFAMLLAGGHCLGMDHERLTFRHQERDFRLTDVRGSVIDRLLS